MPKLFVFMTKNADLCVGARVTFVEHNVPVNVIKIGREYNITMSTTPFEPYFDGWVFYNPIIFMPHYMAKKYAKKYLTNLGEL